MVAKRGTRETRGHLTRVRLAGALSGEMGMPYEWAYRVVGAVLEALRDDVAEADRVVIPGVLVIERNADGARRSHSVRFVLNKRARAAQTIRRMRARVP